MEKTALGSFYGDAEFPIEWREGERELFWVLDDLHCPNPLSPMFFDIGGWWLTCDHMFRRFGTPFASDWIAKEVNGYLYTAAIPADRSVRAESSEYNARYVPRVPDDDGVRRPHRPVSRLGAAALRRELHGLVARPAAARDRAQLRLPRRVRHGRRRADRARRAARGRDRHPRSPLEDPLDDQLRPVLGHARAERDDRRGRARSTPALPGRLQSSRRRPQLGLHRGALADEGGGQGRRRAARGLRGRHRRRRARRAWPPASAAGASWSEGARSVPRRVRAQVDLVARVRLPDLVRESRADHRGRARLPRDRLRLPVDARGACAPTSRRAVAELHGRRCRRARRGSGCRRRSTSRSA